MWNAASRQFFLDQAKPYPYATGGDYVYLYEDPTTGKTYRVHEFLSTGTSTLNVEVGGQMDILVVGGGGGGGIGCAGAGGGGGGVVVTDSPNMDVASYTVTVGAGAVVNTAVNGNYNGLSGGTSSLIGGTVSVTSNGGGGGFGVNSADGGDSGSFVGGSGQISGGCQVYNGGGGGAGAAQNGSNVISDGVNATGGDGGNGVEWPTGSGRYYGGGGGGGLRGGTGLPGNGGLGGGGNGGRSVESGATFIAPQDGAANTGGGGGGMRFTYVPSWQVGGAGGSGIVIVRYVVAEKKLWTPSELTSVKAWYKADSISGVNDGDQLFTWEDSGPNGWNAKALNQYWFNVPSNENSRTAAQIAPVYRDNFLNNLPVVDFNIKTDGNRSCMDIAGSGDWNDGGERLSTRSRWRFMSAYPYESAIFVVCKANQTYSNDLQYEAKPIIGNVQVQNGVNGFMIRTAATSSSNANESPVRFTTIGHSSVTSLTTRESTIWNSGTRIDQNFTILSMATKRTGGDTSWPTGDTNTAPFFDWRINGVKKPSGSGTLAVVRPVDQDTNPWAVPRLGGRPKGDSGVDYATGGFGWIAEIVMLDQFVDQTDRQKMEGYLAHKWGLTNNLPSGHPYKYEPPYKVEPEEIVTDGLVLNLDAGDYASYPRSGTTWYDVSGNGLNGTLTNGPTYDSANKGSIVFDGVNDTVSTPSVNLTSTNSVTVEMFCKLNSYVETPSTAKILFEFSSNFNSQTNAFAVSVQDASNVNFSGYPININIKGNVGHNITSYSKTLVNDLEWHHLVFVFDTSLTGSEGKLFVDGQEVSGTLVNTLDKNNTNNFGNHSFFIGSRNNSLAFKDMNCSVFRVYNRALSSTEITQNFNALRGRYGI